MTKDEVSASGEKRGSSASTGSQNDRFDIQRLIVQFEECLLGDTDVSLPGYLKMYGELNLLFPLLGRLFSFVGSDVKDKITILEKHAASPVGENYATVQKMLEYEVAQELTRKYENNGVVNGSRTLLRLHRALEFVIKLIERISQVDDSYSMSHLAQEAYASTLHKHHTALVRSGVAIALYTLPTRRDFIAKLEHGVAAERESEILGNMLTSAQAVYDRVHVMYTGLSLHNLA